MRGLRPLGSFGWGAILLLTASVFFACTSGDQTYSALEPEGVPAEPTLAQVRPVIDRFCVPCHQSGHDGGEPGSGNLKDIDLKSCSGLWRYRADVLRTVFEKTMPPGAWPRLDDREFQLIVNWVSTTSACPCEDCP